MARLDLYRIAPLEGYVLEVQADLLSGLATTIVVPLVPLAATSKPISRLNPVFSLQGVSYVMLTQTLAAVTRRELGAAVGSLADSHHYDVLNALDMLLTGT